MTYKEEFDGIRERIFQETNKGNMNKDGIDTTLLMHQVKVLAVIADELGRIADALEKGKSE